MKINNVILVFSLLCTVRFTSAFIEDLYNEVSNGVSNGMAQVQKNFNDYFSVKDQQEFQNVTSTNGTDKQESQNVTNTNGTDKQESQDGTNTNGTDKTCVKKLRLTRDLNPICGSDGVIYGTDEDFEYAKCINKGLSQSNGCKSPNNSK